MPRLGTSDLDITPVGLGTWAIGGDWKLGWGPQDDDESVAAIRYGLESGIGWIDTAPVYGLGHAEKIVARALRDLGDADRPMVFTKCGLVWDDAGNVDHCIKADSIRREIDDSLGRLETDVLDLCQIHWPAFPPGSPAPDIEEACTVLAELRDAGKIRHVGVSNFDAAQMQRALAITPIVSLQPPYSMLMREIETATLPFCTRHDVGVLAYSPMHNGLLSGAMTRERIAALPDSDWRVSSSPAFREPHLTRNLELVELLRDIGARHGRTAGEVAISWTLRLPVVTAAIVGARRAGQVDGFIGAMKFRLSESEIDEIETRLPDSVEMFSLS